VKRTFDQQQDDNSTPTWLGSHTLLTDQPSLLVVEFTALPVTPEPTATLVRTNGSAPTQRNIDFTGLRNLVRDACTAYTEGLRQLAAQIPAPSAAELAARESELRDRVAQLVLVYNYFAFAAPIEASQHQPFLEAHALINAIASPTSRLRFQKPL
jgi:hypothetical protein